MTQTQRPDFHRFHNGSKVALPFSDAEYKARLAGLRAIMGETGVTAAIFTSMHNIAYYCGFLYCAFGRPYGLVVTDTECVTISAGIDAGATLASQLWRQHHLYGLAAKQLLVCDCFGCGTRSCGRL